MSRFSGKQQRGAQAISREIRREEAEKRNAVTPPSRRSTKSRGIREPK